MGTTTTHTAAEAHDHGHMTTEVFGREVTVNYHESTLGYAILSLRLIMGWVFLQAGIDKLLDPGWTAAGYLQHAIHPNNPLAAWFTGMAGSALVDGLVIWGFVLIGVALLLGVAVRWSAFWGATMMVLFWLSALQGGLLAGLPLEHGWVVDDHLVYAALLFGLGALGAGRILGLDRKIEEMEVVKRNTWLTYLLG